MVDAINSFTLDGLPSTLTVLGLALVLRGLSRVLIAFTRGAAPVPAAVLTLTLGAGALLSVLALREHLVTPLLSLLGVGADDIASSIEERTFGGALYSAGIMLIAHLLAAVVVALVLAGAYWATAWIARSFHRDRSRAEWARLPQPPPARAFNYEAVPTEEQSPR